MKLNGYPVIHRARHRYASERYGNEPGYTPRLEAVIVYREDDVIAFVVATWSPSMGSTWHQGDYHSNLPDALEAFEQIASPVGADA